MITIIDKPDNIEKSLLAQLTDMVDEGEQVQRNFIERGIQTAELIALIIDETKIITSATLKNPLPAYREKVFEFAGVEISKKGFTQELGYIVTNPEYEKQGYCQKLLTDFFRTIGEKQMFATTRKPSMAHILKKNGFEKLGHTYKNDLELFVYASNNNKGQDKVFI